MEERLLWEEALMSYPTRFLFSGLQDESFAVEISGRF